MQPALQLAPMYKLCYIHATTNTTQKHATTCNLFHIHAAEAKIEYLFERVACEWPEVLSNSFEGALELDRERRLALVDRWCCVRRQSGWKKRPA